MENQTKKHNRKCRQCIDCGYNCFGFARCYWCNKALKDDILKKDIQYRLLNYGHNCYHNMYRNGKICTRCFYQTSETRNECIKEYKIKIKEKEKAKINIENDKFIEEAELELWHDNEDLKYSILFLKELNDGTYQHYEGHYKGEKSYFGGST